MPEPAIEDPKGRTNEGQEPNLIAYRVSRWPPMRLVTASSSRDWMDATPNRFANRCLPLRIASQAGWFVLNSHALRVTWNGGVLGPSQVSLLSEAAVEGDQFLVRMVLSQKGRDGLLEEALVVRGTVIGGADAVDQRQGRLWPEACVRGPAGDAQHPSCFALSPTPRPEPAPTAGAARAP